MEKSWLDIIQTKRNHQRPRRLVVGVILAVGVALLQGRGRGARDGGGGGRDGGAGGFDPGLGEQGGGHGDLDELVALNQPDQSFEALERRLSVSLLPQQPLPQVHALLHTQETPPSTSCQRRDAKTDP